MTDIPHPERLRRSKPWFKVWARHTIYGTTFEELPAVPRAVWFSLLCLACDSPEPGKIGVGVPINIGYTNAQIAELVHLSEAEISEGIRLLNNEEIKKISVGGQGVITICNWKIYQSDYQRQKAGRKKGSSKGSPKGSAKGARKGSTIPLLTEDTEVTEVTEGTETDLSQRAREAKEADKAGSSVGERDVSDHKTATASIDEPQRTQRAPRTRKSTSRTRADGKPRSDMRKPSSGKREVDKKNPVRDACWADWKNGLFAFVLNLAPEDWRPILETSQDRIKQCNPRRVLATILDVMHGDKRPKTPADAVKWIFYRLDAGLSPNDDHYQEATRKLAAHENAGQQLEMKDVVAKVLQEAG